MFFASLYKTCSKIKNQQVAKWCYFLIILWFLAFQITPRRDCCPAWKAGPSATLRLKCPGPVSFEIKRDTGYCWYPISSCGGVPKGKTLGVVDRVDSLVFWKRVSAYARYMPYLTKRSACLWFDHIHLAELLRLFDKRTIESGKTYTSPAGCQVYGIGKIKFIFIPWNRLINAIGIFDTHIWQSE